MLFPRTLPRVLPLFGLFLLVALPSSAAEFSIFPDSLSQAGKGKKGDAPPRPRPKPGPKEGGDED